MTICTLIRAYVMTSQLGEEAPKARSLSRAHQAQERGYRERTISNYMKEQAMNSVQSRVWQIHEQQWFKGNWRETRSLP